MVRKIIVMEMIPHMTLIDRPSFRDMLKKLYIQAFQLYLWKLFYDIYHKDKSLVFPSIIRSNFQCKEKFVNIVP